MPHLLLVCCVLVFALTSRARAQQLNVDSIHRVLKNSPSDTVRLHILSQLTEELPEGQWQRYNDTLLSFVQEKLPSSSVGTRTKFMQALGSAYNNKSIDLKYQGSTDQALQFGEKALVIFNELKDVSNTANVLYNNGRLYNSLGNVSKAIACLNQSQRLYEQTNDNGHRVYNLNVLGSIYKDQKEFEKARESHQQALTLAKRINDKQAVAFSMGCLGQLYATEKSYDSAVFYLKKQVGNYTALHIDQDVANGYYSLASVQKNQLRYADALGNYANALQLYQKIKDTNGEARITVYLGELHLLMNQYDKANAYLDKGLILAKQLGYPRDIQLAADGLYQIYKHDGKTKEALSMLELSKQMNDSIQSTNASRAVLKNQFKYEYDKKVFADSISAAEQQILFTAKIQQARTERYLLITLASLILVIAGFIYYRVRSNQKLKELRFRNEVANDLHDDLGSALSSISIFSEVAKRKLQTHPEDASGAVNEIGNISRSVLEEMSDIVWAISPRNDSINVLNEKMESFARKLLAEADIEFHLHVDEGVQQLRLTMEGRKNLYLIFKEAVNNAAKYSKAQRIDVNLHADGKNLQLSIADNGVGFTEEAIEKGNGLKNMRERAKEIGALLKIRSAPNEGTTLNLNLTT